MRRQTLKECESQRDALMRDNTLLGIALNAVLNKETRQTHVKGVWTLRLLRLTSAHGGIAVVAFHPPGQEAYSNVRYLEEWVSEVREQVRCVGVGNPETSALAVLKDWALEQVHLANKKLDSLGVNGGESCATSRATA